jgi:hypothetical protein
MSNPNREVKTETEKAPGGHVPLSTFDLKAESWKGRDEALGPLAAAQRYVEAGLSVVPIRKDGTKRPAVNEWKHLEERLPTADEVKEWWAGRHPPGIAIIGGKVSGNLEQLDFDYLAEAIYPEWCALVRAECEGLVERLSIVRTPRRPVGYHARYRLTGMVVPGNLKLASVPNKKDDGKKVVAIETRGEGGYAVAPGSPATCHENKKCYKHVGGAPLTNLAVITAEEREVLIRCARAFDLQVDEPPSRRQAHLTTSGSGDPATTSTAWVGTGRISSTAGRWSSSGAGSATGADPGRIAAGPRPRATAAGRTASRC